MITGDVADRPVRPKSWEFARSSAIFFVLTILTQIGGFVFLAAFTISSALKISGRLTKLAIFLGLYGAATVLASAVAPAFGRVSLSCFDKAAALQVQSPLFCLLNRNYVTVTTRRAAMALSTYMTTEFPGTITLALDANFPFFDGFPLLPHLSHNDGRKLDIAFYYQDPAGKPLIKTRSPIGYFAFEQPTAGIPLPCAGRRDVLTFRWDFSFLQPFFGSQSLDEVRTAAAVRWLSTEGKALGVEKIFVEPHLVRKLAVENDIVRFQGCRAARHDDHIHFQVAP